MPKIRICPKCKEPKLKNMMNVSGWLAPPMFECLKCGYVGSVFLEIDPENIASEDNQDEEKDL